jgi:hypothetical protein
MKLLFFTTRLALICNLLFLVCVAIQRTHDFVGNEQLNNYIIILGWFVAPILNLMVNLWWSALLVMSKAPTNGRWLFFVNALFLVLQCYILLINN